MASSKSALKAIKALIDSSDFEQAAEQAQNLVTQDEKNYNALIFLGFAHEKLGHFDKAEAALLSALSLKGEDLQASKGLLTLYEKQGTLKIDQYYEIVHRIAKIYADQEDRNQCHSVVDRHQFFCRKHGSQSQYRRALELSLPTSDLYPVLEGRVPHPSHTYWRILESAEAEEKQWINTQIGERRTRLGAKIDHVTQQVRYEAIAKFNIEEKYQALIDWTTDDDSRHSLEEKLLQRAFENLRIVGEEGKPTQRDRVLNTANGMVIIKHKFELAWDVALEWVDSEQLQDWDVNILREYTDYFPEAGLAKVLRGFLNSNLSPFPAIAPDPDSLDTNETLSEADQLIMMVEGVEQCSGSMLAHRILASTYLSLEEHQSAVDIARVSKRLYLEAQKDFALELRNSIDAVDLTLAKALITYQSPRHHPESRVLFQDILERKPTLTEALLGIGLILEEDEDYGEAVKFLKQASDREPTNLRIRLEFAWCHALDHDLEVGLTELEKVLVDIESEKVVDLIMKSEVLYRIAYCKWNINSSAAARKDKSGSYRYLIDAVKANPSYAPAYTLLGIYFQDYGKSKQRARVALQKAFELSTSELTAAERLAQAFARAGEWDLVELVAQRVIDSGKARPAPGSKRKAFSWPYAAMGVVQMNRQQYSQSIVSFQAALRIAPQDYHSWIGLGESYHSSGRFIAASKAFVRAESIDHGLPPSESWAAKFMLANVQREVGAFDDAIRGYENVLEIVKDEFGVLVALLQTYTESAWAKIAQGLFGQSIELSIKAMHTATTIAKQRSDSFNLWKAFGDACSVIAQAKAFAKQAGISEASTLLQIDISSEALNILSDVDKVSIESLETESLNAPTDVADKWLQATILAHKRAIHACAHDSHAQAVAWFNLGWAEHNAYVSAGPSLSTKKGRPSRFLKAAMRCFKRAIELEAGNSEFWNALGVVTLTFSPKVSQHSFVRSLHLNDHSARTWTNLGILYLVNNDSELANEAFTRAQSADPEYSAAWIGQGLLAALYGNVKEARGLFVHAFEIADSAIVSVKRHYSASAFDHLLQDPSVSQEVSSLLQPLYALRQLRVQQPVDIPYAHLLSLYTERVYEFEEGSQSLEEVCNIVEAEYEKSESSDSLVRYAQAKADLARLQLGSGDYDAAIQNAETALDLSSEDGLGPSYASQRQKLRLSAHLTGGLANGRLENTDSSIEMLQAALKESGHAPDIVCMLAQVLWAKGGQAEKDVARAQLFECIEQYPEHVQAISLLAVIGLLDSDDDVLDAVEDDLKSLRMSDKVGVADRIKVSQVLAGIYACRQNSDSNSAQSAAAADAKVGIMLSPGQPQGWLELVAAADETHASEMALKNARNQIPPHGKLQAASLASAHASNRKEEDLLVATMLAPWLYAESIAV